MTARTVLFLHAHPDDEALLTGGTMARLAAEGHRVLLATATDGGRGLTGLALPDTELAHRRASELADSAGLLGCSAVFRLGYADSGLDGDAAGRHGFCRVAPQQVAEQVADLLRSERVDLLCGYDAAGGYGHPDHRQVHRVARAAATLAGGVVLVETTLDRRLLQWALRLGRPVLPSADQYRPQTVATRFADPTTITHSIDVRRWVSVKRAALAAHVSQTSGGEEQRLLGFLAGLPRPVAAAVLGREWFVQVGRPAGRRRSAELLDGLR